MAPNTSNKMAAEEVYDVVVIGAGLAGLSTAYSLLKKDPTMRVMILEARDRVGGRTLTQAVKVGDGKTELFDMGAHWVGPKQEHIMKIINELGVETFSQYCTGKKFMQFGGNAIKSFDGDRHTVGGWFAWAEYNIFMWRLDRMTPLVSMSDPYSSPLAYELEGLTVSAYARKYLRTKAALDAVDQSIKGVFGTDASRMGMLFFLASANTSGGMKQLYGVEDTAQDTRFKHGAQDISKRLADAVGNDKILLSHAVTEIQQEEELVSVLFCRIDPTTNLPVKGEAVRGVQTKRVVCSVPPNLLTKITFNPPLDYFKRFLCENLLMGNLEPFVVTFKTAFWREKGFSGEIYSSGGTQLNDECSTTPLCECYDFTTFDGAPAIIGFIAGRNAVEWIRKTKAERCDAIIKTLVSALGSESSDYIAYEDYMWGEDPWTGGSPGMYSTPGTLYALPHLRTPHGRVHFAGAEMAIEWMGYMSGAVASGEGAAVEILAKLRPDLLNEEEKQAAVETSTPRGQFVAQPSSAIPWKVLTATGVAVVATLLSFW